MIKNELFDNVENMKRKLVQKKIMEEDEDVKKTSHHGHVHKIPKEVKPVIESNNTQVKDDDKLLEQTDQNQKSDDCANSLTCADFKEDPNMKQKGFEKDNMKELYDFVFDDDKKDDLLEKQFNISTTQVTEKNEVDLHHELKSSIIKEDENDIMKCNFEIIGNIEEDNENDVVGLDYLSQNAFAKMI
jgi:hypothetical protein